MSLNRCVVTSCDSEHQGRKELWIVNIVAKLLSDIVFGFYN